MTQGVWNVPACTSAVFSLAPPRGARLRAFERLMVQWVLLLFVILSALAPSPAHASIPTETRVYFSTNFGRSDPILKSGDACTDLAIKLGVATELRLGYYCYYDARRWGGYGFELSERLAISPYCPPNSTVAGGVCVCKANYQEDLTHSSCVFEAPEIFAAANKCSAPVYGIKFGNPILPATAEKFRLEIDFAEGGPSPLSFGRTYRSAWGTDSSRVAGPLGKAWAHSHDAKLKATTAVAVIESDEGSLRTFTRSSTSSPWNASNSADGLMTEADGTWTHRRADDGRVPFRGVAPQPGEG